MDYVAHTSGYTLSLSGGNATLDLKGASSGSDSLVQMQLVSASATPQAIGLDCSPTKLNYFSGSDPSQWHTNVPNYYRVEYQNVYAGINLDFSNNHGQVEYDYVVAPGADARVIQMTIQGAQASLDAAGNLVLHTPAGDVVEQAPVVYQDIGGVRQSVAGQFTLSGNTVGFQLGAYDHARSLVIDPTLIYKSTILPQAGFAIAADSAGDAYVVGNSDFVGKLNPSGTAFIYQTHFGISIGMGIAVDSSGNAYIAGQPGASFVTTANAYSTTPSNGFVTELDPTGANLLYSSYIPGGNIGYGQGALGQYGAIAIDSAGDMYVTGCTTGGLSTTSGAFQSAQAGSYDAFFAEFNPSLSGNASLLYCSYLGEGFDQGTGIAVDGSGNAYLSGIAGAGFPTTAGAYQTANAGGLDAFVAKFNPSLSGSASLVYSTFLGGSNQDGYFRGEAIGADPYWPGCGIAVDSAGEAFVAGVTASSNFPVTSGALQTTFKGGHSGGSRNTDAFVTKLNAAGSALVYSTYLGGSTGGDICNGIAVDSHGNATVTGFTSSTDFPTKNPIQAKNAGSYDALVATLNASGSALIFSTYLGTSNTDQGCGVALDSSGNIYETGYTRTSPFTGFVYKISAPVAPTAPAATIGSSAPLAAVNVPILPPSPPAACRPPASQRIGRSHRPCQPSTSHRPDSARPPSPPTRASLRPVVPLSAQSARRCVRG